MTNRLSPLLLLVRPQLGENIGAAARAMSNFGLSELRLVAPRDGWPNPKALEMAAGAEAILRAAAVYPDFSSATADIHLAYATTARPRDMEKRVVEPAVAMREVAELLRGWGDGRIGGDGENRKRKAEIPPHPHLSTSPHPPRIALVFGPERSGLENEEITRCDTLITIPTAAENRSLNIAQSAVILGYEWWKLCSVASDPCSESDSNHRAQTTHTPATLSEWDGLFAQLEGYLDATDYFRTPDKKPVMWQNLQTMLRRARLTSQEVRSLRGMLRSLWERRKG